VESREQMPTNSILGIGTALKCPSLTRLGGKVLGTSTKERKINKKNDVSFNTPMMVSF
jgi:hypothetical protein